MLAPFERLLDAHGSADLLPELERSGFLAALVELPLADVEPLLRALGRRAIDAPVVETMAARAFLEPSRPLLAIMTACEMAGLGERLLEMSIEHANQRSQFGKPIGRFQAVQQQLAVMAEQVILVRIAAEAACVHGLAPSESAAAMAKSVGSKAAPVIAGIAHAVHGAIGITAEFPLHRYTARLHALRMAYGSESYWNARIGAARLQSDGTSLEFVRGLHVTTSTS
nr:acyl-CoA dehydrogenase family protein [Sphingomonas sp. ID1715]